MDGPRLDELVTDGPGAELLAGLVALGWSEAFAGQLTEDDAGFAPVRVATVHRSRIAAMSPDGPRRLTLPVGMAAAGFAVGDWVLAEPSSGLVHRRLARKALLERRLEGGKPPQLIAANIDTLFIVTSCTAEFNPARLERYLALANEAGTEPVIVLTKADAVPDAEAYRQRAIVLQRALQAVCVDATDAGAALVLAPWCGAGRTVALVGSSGVGKSTLLNTLAGPDQAIPQETGGVREIDGRGRHTTTGRSLHAIAGGGLVIDTPGMRSLHVSDTGFGIETLFAEITERAPACKFRDCTHTHEPGCAVQAAVAAGEFPAERLMRWRKLNEESLGLPPSQPRPNGAARGKKR